MNTRYFYIVAIVAMLVVTACQKETPAPAGDTTTNTFSDCDSYCKAQPRAQCVGEWMNSGEYPDCTCKYECATEETTAPVTEEPAIVEDKFKVVSSDEQFYVQVGEGNEVTAGYVTYNPGTDNLNDADIADRVIIGGPGISDVATAEIYMKIGTNAPKLKALMHKVTEGGKTVFDSPLQSGERGILTFKLYDASGKLISQDLEIGIIPEIV
ncbi:MAG: hypothetical protein ABIJ21_03160 [Nanoarchaeota archaeon]